MKCAIRSIRVSVAGLVAVSLATVTFCTPSPVAVARSAPATNHRHCCGNCNGKCCGMACCKPSEPTPAFPPVRTISHFKSLVLAKWHAPATGSPADIEQGVQRAAPLAQVLSPQTLQSVHVRIQT